MTAFLGESPCCIWKFPRLSKDNINRKTQNKKNALPFCCYYFGNCKFSLLTGLLHNTVYLTVKMSSPQIGDLKFWNFDPQYLGEYLFSKSIIINLLLIVTAFKNAGVFASNRNNYYEMIENRTIATSSR